MTKQVRQSLGMLALAALIAAVALAVGVLGGEDLRATGLFIALVLGLVGLAALAWELLRD